MKRSTLLFSALYAVGSAAGAATQTASGTVPLAGFEGYGYSYSATWTSSTPYGLTVSSGGGVFDLDDGTYRIGQLTLFLDSTDTGAAGHSSLDLDVAFTVKVVNLTSGEVALPAAVLNPGPGETSFTSMAPSWVFQGGPMCVRPANPGIGQFYTQGCTYAFTSQSIDAQDGRLAAGSEATVTLNSRTGRSFVSPDPACASFSCMTPINDVLNIPRVWMAANVTLQPVPEPASAALLMAGIALIGVARRRRGSLSIPLPWGWESALPPAADVEWVRRTATEVRAAPAAVVGLDEHERHREWSSIAKCTKFQRMPRSRLSARLPVMRCPTPSMRASFLVSECSMGTNCDPASTSSPRS